MSRSLHRCPTCRHELAWDPANRFRPFCSERCRLIDLGAWLEEAHAIPGEPAMEAGSGGEPDDRGPARSH